MIPLMFFCAKVKRFSAKPKLYCKQGHLSPVRKLTVPALVRGKEEGPRKIKVEFRGHPMLASARKPKSYHLPFLMRMILRHAVSTPLSARLNSPIISVFSIDCISKNLHTSRLKPYTIKSDVTLKELVTVVAEKMNVFAKTLELQYRLISKDKPSASATDVTTDEELQILIKKLRVLSVPQLLPNGKKSSKSLSPPTVRFEVAGEVLQEQVKSAGVSKKVYLKLT
jgi:hypothetical protein